MKKINNLLKTSWVVPLAFTASSFLNVSQNPKLEEFNLKNKQVYEDFRNFSLDRLMNEEIPSNKYTYFKKIENNFYEFIYDNLEQSINLIKDSIYITNDGTMLPGLYGFYDDLANGLNDHGKDVYIQYFHIGNGSVMQDNLKVSEIDKEKQLELAMEYVESLKKIMNHEKILGY